MVVKQSVSDKLRELVLQLHRDSEDLGAVLELPLGRALKPLEYYRQRQEDSRDALLQAIAVLEATVQAYQEHRAGTWEENPKPLARSGDPRFPGDFQFYYQPPIFTDVEALEAHHDDLLKAEEDGTLLWLDEEAESLWPSVKARLGEEGSSTAPQAASL